MPIITIRGQLGSGAPEIGRIVANKFHCDYVDREIIAQVAARLKWSEEGIAEKERPASTIMTRIAEALAHAYPVGPGYSGAYLPTWEIPLDDVHYLAGLESVIKELAGSQSIVIRGRGSQFILKDFPGAFHVLVVAPLDVRVKRVAEEFDLTEERAKREIARFDNARNEFTKRYFHAELENPIYYHLVINTKRVSFEVAAAIVFDACNETAVEQTATM